MTRLPWLLSMIWIPLATAEVVIHEIHYHPEERGQPLEFIELYNHGDQSVDLSAWQLTEAISFTFPAGTLLAPHAYLIVAQDPTRYQHLDVIVLGPWTGKLDNDGEAIILTDPQGRERDVVDYGVGFPWPCLADGGGASMELIHPSLDNDLGGSWRASLPRIRLSREPVTFLAPQDPHWRYFKGFREPPREWKSREFDHRHWAKGQTPIGYADGDDRTVLTDMLGNYTTVFMRHHVDIAADHPLDRPITLRVYSDDGAIVWINGREVARLRVPAHESSHRAQTTRNHEAAWEEIVLSQPQQLLRNGDNLIAVLGVNGNPTSSDFSIDVALAETRGDLQLPSPTPGQPNHTFDLTPPPQIRQVDHEPKRVQSGQSVRISAKVTDPDGVAAVMLEWQAVRPGDYIALTDARYAEEWTTLPMRGERDIYSIDLPGEHHRHRHLYRYRLVARDRLGEEVRVPYANDDPQPNFAYYVNDGPAPWTGANIPGRTPKKTFSATLMEGVPNLTLIAQDEAVENSQYGYRYNEQFLPGTLVVDDHVYDHIRFRNRGETTTYMVGKNKWRLNFNRTHEFRPATLDGGPKARRWKRLNLNPGTAPYHPHFRGNAALNERLAFRLYQLAGIPAPDTAHVLWRVVDAPEETTPDQYSGDLWGLYMAFEAIDGFLLNNHDLPDGELHRISQSGNSVERAAIVPAPPGLTFPEFWQSLHRSQSQSWWAQAIDLDYYYRYHALSIATARGDQKLNHNHFLYRHPVGGWRPLPWDTDLCLQPILYDPDGYRWQTLLKHCLEHTDYQIAYANQARELLDLLFTRDQITVLVDELIAGLGPMAGPNLAELDQFLWNHHPQTTPQHRGTYFLTNIPVPRQRHGYRMRLDPPGFAGRVRYFKDYLCQMPPDQRQPWLGLGYRQLALDSQDPHIPSTPVIQRLGQDSSLTFRCGPYHDPQGADTFEGMRWRIGEIDHPGIASHVAGDANRYEVETVWESPILTSFESDIDIDAVPLHPGRTYRLRARFGDDSGRWSHWSEPITFIAPEPEASPYQKFLTITEIMYHPKDGPHAAEFIELTNIGKSPLDLRPLAFSEGIHYHFSEVTLTQLQPGQRIVITNDRARFLNAYPNAKEALIGTWTAGKLDNGGERLSLQVGKGTPFLQIRYDDNLPWPTEADGQGPSLERNPDAPHADVNDASHWRASTAAGGTPGH